MKHTKHIKRKYFAFSSGDAAAAEQWLNMQAENGLKLIKISPLRVAKFQAEEEALQYAVIPWHNQAGAVETNSQEFAAYKEFAAGCGWEYVAQMDALNIFAAKKDVPPLESDPVSELLTLRRFEKQQVSWAWVYPVFLALALLWGWSYTNMFYISGYGRSWAILFAFNTALSCAVLCAVLLCVAIVKTASLPRRLKRIDRAMQTGEPLSARSLQSAYRGGIFSRVLVALSAVLIVGSATLDIAQDEKNAVIALMICTVMIFHMVPQILYRRVRHRWTALFLCIGLGAALMIGAASVLNREHTPVKQNIATLPVLTGVVQDVETNGIQRAHSPVIAYCEYFEDAPAVGRQQESTRSVWYRCATEGMALRV
ncbi:DUF2812 domain-containing protein, partial [Christensenellaceae bacterium OttesenSCG-928-L17]|nr:DUF2812 domain-containing protein [Christensenellaceae bacterium OttesenSCG-928-L17]